MSDYAPLTSTTWSECLGPSFRTDVKQHLVNFLMVNCGGGGQMHEACQKYAALVERQTFVKASSKEDYYENICKISEELKKYNITVKHPKSNNSEMIIQLKSKQQNITFGKIPYKLCKKTKKSKVTRAFWYYLNSMILVVLFLICVELGYILAIKMFGDC